MLYSIVKLLPAGRQARASEMKREMRAPGAYAQAGNPLR